MNHGKDFMDTLLIILVCIGLIIPILEFISSMVRLKFEMRRFPWRKWMIDTIPILLMTMICFGGLKMDIDVWLCSLVAFIGYFCIHWLLEKTWK